MSHPAKTSRLARPVGRTVWQRQRLPSGQAGVTGKYRHVARILDELSVKSVLDIGCRDGVLGRTLVEEGATVQYTSLDIAQNETGSVDIVCDIGEGIPAPEGSFDAVVALDVLEHIDGIHQALAELVRVASRHVVVVLPNIAHFRHRLRFLLTARVGGKYDLELDPAPDRHRWLTVVPQIDEFVAGFAARHHLGVRAFDLSAGRRSGWVEQALRLAGLRRSWHVWAVLYVLTKKAEDVKPKPVRRDPCVRP